MNIKYILSGIAVTSMAFTSCSSDLDTAPQGSTLTSEQKSNIISAEPARGAAGVRAIFSNMNQYEPNYEALGNSARHNDFGFSSVFYFTDANSEDQSSSNSGYNWAGNSLIFNDRPYTSRECQIVWNDHYSTIYAANNVIAGYSDSDVDPEDEQGKYFYAQGLAARAYMYLSLAQLYQFTYKGHEKLDCVPIITDKNSTECATNGAPLATVEEVYAQIKSDIDHAIKLLTNNTTKRDDKRFVSLAVAYGIRARMNLVMQNWTDAAADAEAAIKAAASEGIEPASIADVSKPYFANSTEKDWMWGILISETDDVVSSGIVNWISHCGTFNYGYGQYAGGHQINKKLYNQIPSTDVRSGWWSGADGKCKNLDDEWNAYLTSYGFPAYTNCKFNTYNGELECDVNANDIPLMRIEEMYYIEAEALAMAGKDGKSFLESFVQTYRDPGFESTGNIQEEIYFQKRIEFWGEGLIWYDFMRLEKDLDRRGGGFVATAVFNLKSNDPILLWRVPQKEINANNALTEENTNTDRTVAVPTAIADK